VRGATKRFPTRTLERKQKSYIAGITRKSADDVEELTEHPLLELLDHANSQMTGIELVELTALYEELTGNAYWYLVDSPLGVPSEVWPLMSQYVKIVPDPEKFIAGYIYGKTSIDQVGFKPEEVIHFSYPNPADLFYGMGPLEAALLAVDRSTSMAEYEQALFDNNSRPDFAIKVAEGTTEAERKRLYAEWKERFEGRKKSGKPVILQGEMDIQTIGYSPRDSTLLLLAKFSREEIANIFGIPMTMLEISAARAEAESQMWAYCEFTLKPRLRRLEQKLTEALASRYDPRLFLAFDDPTPANVELRLKEVETHLRTGYSCINEERSIDGQDDVEWGAIPLLPGGIAPLGSEKPGEEVPLKPGENPDAPKGLKHLATCTCATCKGEGVLLPMTHDEAKLAGSVKAVFDKQYNEVLKKIEEMG
jgi:HK97 family phage portal protein